MCARLPSVLRLICRMAWQLDRTAVLLLATCQLVTGAAAAVGLAATASAMQPVLGPGAVADRLHQALPALLAVASAAALGRLSSALASYADRRLTPPLTTYADTSLVEAVCRVEAAAYAQDGFADRQEAAEMGVVRTHVMVNDAQRFVAALIRMVAASGVLSVLHWAMLPLLLLAVLPSGVGAGGTHRARRLRDALRERLGPQCAAHDALVGHHTETR